MGLHHNARRHIRKHKKNYVRFISFFAFLVAYSILEDIISISIHGVEMDLMVVLNILVIATVFTLISQGTENLYRKEEPKIEKLIRKEEKLIDGEERKIRKRLRR
jgi:sensor domain CHASE-containing protein